MTYTNTWWCHWREGKRACQWSELITLEGVVSAAKPVRRIYRLTGRTIDKHGKPLLLPAYKLKGWTTTLPASFSCADIIALHCDHGTQKQFHSELKKGMDLERLIRRQV